MLLYLVKPFTLSVLLARPRAHLRRRPPTSGRQKRPIRLGDLTVDTTARRCLLAGRDIALRPKEFELLAVLARHAGAAVSREALMAQVWEENWFGPTKTLYVTLVSLRRRLHQAESDAPDTTRLPTITTLRGHGYRLDHASRALGRSTRRGAETRGAACHAAHTNRASRPRRHSVASRPRRHSVARRTRSIR
ncbi:response regulator transcription factor [Streptomyces sp. NPDC059892]|uniref:response regulator transcription factor n=1 Tax=Streptomyces sp. NPDC059892 TaxID=3346989 RepID=UPI0036684BAB